MKQLVHFSIGFLIILTTGFALADPFSATITDGSSIAALQGDACGGMSNVLDIVLPAGCSGEIDPDTGDIAITSCTFAPSTQKPNAIITLSAMSGSGNYDGTNLTVTPNIDVNITDDPPTFISCDSATPISATLTGVVMGSGTISFSGRIPGATFAVSDTCPADIALFLNCQDETITDMTFNLTIP